MSTLINRKTFRAAITHLNKISQLALALMMFLTAADVILRYLFNSPIIFAQEVTELLLVIVVSLGISLCGIDKGHVGVDILANNMPKRLQAIFDCFTNLITIVFFSIIVWRTFVQMEYVAGNRITSLVLFIPLYPFVGIVAFGFSLFTLVIILDFFDSITGVFKK